jgi:hypothetical protein
MNFEIGMIYSTYGEKRKGCMVLVGKPEGKRPLGRPRCTWVDNIKMGRREIKWGYIGCSHLSQDRDLW